jgi:pSer/pThr/pTyr-binding forkhead associated (FHA) protein
MMLELKVRDEEERYVFTYAKVNGIFIGRTDPKATRVPDVDLSRVNGLERGVSREHARIDLLEDSNTLILTDLGSRNGTFLNGQQLQPHKACVLRDGDDVQFGRVFVRISFRGRLR